MKITFLATAALLLAPAAYASTEAAWEEFRTKVEESCAALVGADAQIEVNPFGSESYGVAKVTTLQADTTQEQMICIFDKQSEAVEITAPFAD